MTTCYGYTRVSTVKQGDGVSLDAQREEIARYAERHGLIISQWFEEKETAAKAGRPIFNQIVQDLLNQKADGLVVHKIDRSARNFRDWAKIGELADRGVAIHFATESLDFQSRGGRLTADIQAVIASDYIRNLREEAIKGLRGRLKQGLYPHMAPIGYLDQGGGKAKIPDPARAPLVKEAFEIYATGQHSIRSLCDEMNHRGLRTRRGGLLTKTSVDQMLSNPFYCGIIKIKRTGNTYNGVHQPLISACLFERVQNFKNGRYRMKIHRHLYTFRGLFTCAHCKFSLIAEKQKGRVYYRCHTKDCKTRCVREDILEDGVRAGLSRFELTMGNFERLSTSLEDWQHDRKLQAGTLQVLRLRLSELESRVDALTDALIDRLIDKDTFATRKEKLMIETRKLEEQISEVGHQDASAAKLRKFLELAKNLTHLYEIFEEPEKRLLVKLATSNRVVDGKDVEFEPHEWLSSIHETVDVLNGGALRDTVRTSHPMRNPQVSEIDGLKSKLTKSPEVQELVAIMEKHVGAGTSGSPTLH